MDIIIKITTKDDSLIPAYKTNGAAGLDLHAAMDGEIKPMQRALIPTGICMEIPVGYEGQIRPRSGLALKYGIGMLNSPGTIDSDYRGEIGLILFNFSEETFYFQKGDRLAQIVFSKVINVKIEQTNKLSPTSRGTNGFGSTGL